MDVLFLLAHGGGMGTWIWDRLTPLLDHRALCLETRIDAALDLDRATVADCVAQLVRAVHAAGSARLVVVGHSIGGLVAGVLPVAELPTVAHRVYIAASVPVAGKRALDDLPPGARLLNRVAIRLQQKGVATSPHTMEKMIRSRFCNASDESVIQEVLRHPVLREPPCLAFERIATTTAAHGPSTYIRLLRDGTISPARQTLLAGRLGKPSVVSIEADHMVMLSRPRELADALNEVARLVAG
jgi:pimeloyl-ACP methyl ester carboxylesterase